MTIGFAAAVDLGATSGRVVVGRMGPQVLEVRQVARFRNDPVLTADGLHWDILGLYRAAHEGLRVAAREEPLLASIGIDSWAVDYGLLRGPRLLGDPFHYRDPRSDAGVEAVHSIAPHHELYERNGLQFLPFNSLYQLASEPRELLRFADQMLLIPDLLGFWLTGQARAERTNASTTGLLRLDGRWDDVLIDRLGMPPGLFPELIEPGDELGPLATAQARTIGTSRAVVTAVGSHDTASAVVAAPILSEADAFISCGTWGLVGVELPAPLATAEARDAGFTNEAGVDGRTRFLRNVMGLWILTEAMRSWERADGHPTEIAAVLAAAAEVPATSVPLFDVNDPLFLPPGDIETRIRQWCDDHGLPGPESRAACVRSIIESLAHAFGEAVRDASRLTGIDVRCIRMVGGGSLNQLLCQRTADHTGVPVSAGPVEATAIGNLLVQGRSAGFLTGSLESLRDLVARSLDIRGYTPKADRFP